MRQTTKLKLIVSTIVIGTLLFIVTILRLALNDEATVTFEASKPIPIERLQTYTVQGLGVQTTTTPDVLTILILSALAKDYNERVAIMKEAHLTFNGPLEKFNQLLNQSDLALATSTLSTLDEAKAQCEAAGASFSVYPMAEEPGKTVVADCNIKAKRIFTKEF